MELFAQDFEQERRTEQYEQCTNTESHCLNTPGRDRRCFRSADMDDKGIVAHRTSSHQTSFTVENTWRSIGPTAFRNKPMPRRLCRYFLARANDLIRVVHNDSAVAVQKYKHLIAHRCDGFIDTLEIGEPDTDCD